MLVAEIIRRQDRNSNIIGIYIYIYTADYYCTRTAREAERMRQNYWKYGGSNNLEKTREDFRFQTLILFSYPEGKKSPFHDGPVGIESMSHENTKVSLSLSRDLPTFYGHFQPAIPGATTRLVFRACGFVHYRIILSAERLSVPPSLRSSTWSG